MQKPHSTALLHNALLFWKLQLKETKFYKKKVQHESVMGGPYQDLIPGTCFSDVIPLTNRVSFNWCVTEAKLTALFI